MVIYEVTQSVIHVNYSSLAHSCIT